MDGGKRRSARKKQKEKEVDKDRGTHSSMRIKKPVCCNSCLKRRERLIFVFKTISRLQLILASLTVAH